MRKNKFPSENLLQDVQRKLVLHKGSRLLPKHATIIERTKYEMCEKFVIYFNEQNISQKKMAERLEINESVMSKILHYHIDEFTTDFLIKNLEKIYKEIYLRIEVA